MNKKSRTYETARQVPPERPLELLRDAEVSETSYGRLLGQVSPEKRLKLLRDPEVSGMAPGRILE